MWGLGILSQCRFFWPNTPAFAIFWSQGFWKRSRKHFLSLESPEKDSESIFWSSRVLKKIRNSIFERQRSWMHILSLEGHKNDWIQILGLKNPEKDSECNFRSFWPSRALKRILNSIFWAWGVLVKCDFPRQIKKDCLWYLLTFPHQ